MAADPLAQRAPKPSLSLYEREQHKELVSIQHDQHSTHFDCTLCWPGSVEEIQVLLFHSLSVYAIDSFCSVPALFNILLLTYIMMANSYNYIVLLDGINNTINVTLLHLRNPIVTVDWFANTVRSKQKLPLMWNTLKTAGRKNIWVN